MTYGPGNPDPARVQAYLTDVARLLADDGFMIQLVVGDGEAFGYTVGLTAHDMPELWCSAGPQTTEYVLQAAGDLAIAAGGPLEPGVDLRHSNLSVPLRFTDLRDPRAAEVGLAQQMHPLTPVRVVQVLWPDNAGHFPTDPAYDADRFPQRLLPAQKDQP